MRIPREPEGMRVDTDGKVPSEPLSETRDFVRALLAFGWTRQAICRLLIERNTLVNGLSLHSDDPVVQAARRRVEGEIASEMVNRNVDAGEFERDHKIEEAIALYEANLTDEFSGTTPYERLYRIYSERGDRKNAVRVCERAIAVFNDFPSPSTPAKVERFEAYLIGLKQVQR